MKRVHNFLVKDAKACSVFISQSSQSAGVDATLKLTRLLLISLFLCYEGAELDSSPSVTHPVPKQTKKGHGRKRNAAEISGAETSTEQAGDKCDSCGRSGIPEIPSSCDYSIIPTSSECVYIRRVG